jgi:hypothetical protein
MYGDNDSGSSGKFRLLGLRYGPVRSAKKVNGAQQMTNDQQLGLNAGGSQAFYWEAVSGRATGVKGAGIYLD